MKKNLSKGAITAQTTQNAQSTKMKTYRTLFVTISKDKYHKDFEVHRFPYSSDEKANAAFDSWVAKAKEVLADRLYTFQDLSDEFQKEASFRTDDGIWIDVDVQDDYWDTLKKYKLKNLFSWNIFGEITKVLKQYRR